MVDYCEAGQPDEKGRGGCRAFDPVTRSPAPLEGRPRLCDLCLEPAERDIKALVLDYRDLEQQLPPSLGVWGDGQPKGRTMPLPLSEHVLDLQRDIWWLTTGWADVLRDADRLSMTVDWSKRRRDGLAVQEAMAIVGPRVRRLAELGPQLVWDYPGTSFPCPRYSSRAVKNSTTVLTWSCSQDGVEPCRDCGGTGRVAVSSEVPGWQGVLDLAHLHARARVALGLTQERPELLLAVLCRGCDRRSTLTRSAGSDEVVCSKCSERYSGREYADWVGLDAAASKRDEAA